MRLQVDKNNQEKYSYHVIFPACRLASPPTVFSFSSSSGQIRTRLETFEGNAGSCLAIFLRAPRLAYQPVQRVPRYTCPAVVGTHSVKVRILGVALVGGGEIPPGDGLFPDCVLLLDDSLPRTLMGGADYIDMWAWLCSVTLVVQYRVVF